MVAPIIRLAAIAVSRLESTADTGDTAAVREAAAHTLFQLHRCRLSVGVPEPTFPQVAHTFLRPVEVVRADFDSNRVSAPQPRPNPAVVFAMYSDVR